MRRSARERLGDPGVRPLWRLLALFVALAIVVALPFLIWGAHFETLLARDRLLDWLDGYRNIAWLIGFGLLVSDLLLPIPNTMVMAALGALYGPLIGGLVSVAGNCASGLVGYALCRRFGRPLAVRLLGPRELAAGERLFARSGGLMVAASRWLPVLPEAVCCMAGLTRIRLPVFLLALLCGSAPLGFVVAWLGHAGADRPLLTLLLCALLPLPLWLLVRGAFTSAPPTPPLDAGAPIRR